MNYEDVVSALKGISGGAELYIGKGGGFTIGKHEKYGWVILVETGTGLGGGASGSVGGGQ